MISHKISVMLAILLMASMATCAFIKAESQIPDVDSRRPETSDHEVNNTRPLLRLYNDMDKPTFVLEVSENRPSVIKYWEDLNNIAGFCATGTWILYSGSGYDNGGVGGLVYSNENVTCAGRSWPTKASYLFAGSATNIHALALTTYEGEGYRGNSFVYENEGAVILDPFSSFIITGNNPITFYSRENFGGFSMCIDAPQNGLGGGLRNVTINLGLLPEDIRSFKFGCSPDMSRIPLEKNFDNKFVNLDI